MKGSRKWLSLCLIPVLLAAFLPMQYDGNDIVYAEEAAQNPVSGNCGIDVQWKITEDTETEWDLADSTPYKLTITGTGEMDFGVNALSPWYEYDYYKTITSVSIEEGITNIPAGAFSYCVSLKSITLPDSVTEIGDAAFDSCSLLETVVCGSGLKTIGRSAFSRNVSLISAQFQEGLERIDKYAFSDCGKLSEITLPKSVAFLGEQCFRDTVITSLMIPENMVTVESSILLGNRSLQSIQSAEGSVNFKAVDNVLYELKDGKPYRTIAYAAASPSEKIQIQEGTQIIDEWSFCYANYITGISFPSTLKEINEGGFFWCQRLKELNIPDGVETIADRAFNGCGITKVTVGNGLRAMPGAIFESCTKLGTVVISDQNPYLEAIDNVVYDKEHTIFYFYPAAKPDTEYRVLDSVESLADYCIEKANSLEELYMPENLVRLGDGALTWNHSLNSIYFRGDAPQLGFQSIRENGDKLLIYYISTAGGWDASHWKSYNLTLWDPNNHTQEEGSFEGITWKYQGDIGRIKFTGTGKIPDFTEEDPAPWNAYMGQIQTIEADGAAEIGDYAFYRAEKLLRFETGSLKAIGDYTFADCGKLLYIDVGGTETIGAGAFQNGASIRGELVLREITSIGTGAFEGCAALESAVLGGCIELLEERAFAGCASLSGFLVPDSVTAIKTGAFMGSGLRTINIPANVNFIGAQAFKGNAGLEKVYFYGGIPENWAGDSFQDCGKLTLCYRKSQSIWEGLGDSWQDIPLLGLDRFYTERRDHYSFNNSATSFGYPADYRVPRQRYVDVLNSIVSGSYYYAISGNWGGSCYGMAGSTLEFYENPEFDAADYGQAAECLYALAAPGNKNAALTKLIEAFQISQYKSAIAACGGILSRNRGKYLEIIQKVEEFERSGGLSVDSKAEPILLALDSRYNGHAVIPVSVDQAEDGGYLMKVYDPNKPQALQTLKINKNLNSISYKYYTSASYLDYSVITSAMSGVELHSSAGIESLYLSIDKEGGEVENKEGKGIEEIEGAYEQKLFQGSEEDVFSGIRSFVLPKGSYQIAEADAEGLSDTVLKTSAGDTEKGVTFYLASEENYAQITSSDEHAVLEVNQTETETQEEKVEIKLISESAEEETAHLTLINEEGMERTLEVEGSNAAVTVTGDDTITIEAPQERRVTMDGRELEMKDGLAAGSFVSSEEEDSCKAKDYEIEISCDAQNRLNGTVNLAVISGETSRKEVTVTASFLTMDGKQAAVYSQDEVLNPGRNFITLTLEETETFLEEEEGEIKLLCEIEIRDGNGESFCFSAGEATVFFTEQEQKPGPEEPEDPEKPGPEEPEHPEPAPSIPVTEIKLNTKNLVLGVGESFTLEALDFPGNASDRTLKFLAMNDRVEVTEEGKITARKPGVSYVLVKSSGEKQETVTVVVKKAPEGITLNAREKKLNPGESFRIEVELAEDAASSTITYSTSDAAVAAVTEKGMVTAIKEGKAVISAETYNGKKAELFVTVKRETAVQEVKVPVKKLILGAGESCMLGAYVEPGNANDKTLSYQASNSRVSVSSKGKVKAKKPGTSRITVRASNGKQASVLVKVKKAPRKITLNASKKMLKRGGHFTVKAKLPKNTASHKITYTSSRKAVAAVSSKGRITAKKKGKAVITVKTFNKKKASIRITVR